MLHAFFEACQQGQNPEKLLKGTKGAIGSHVFPPRILKHDEWLGF